MINELRPYKLLKTRVPIYIAQTTRNKDHNNHCKRALEIEFSSTVLMLVQTFKKKRSKVETWGESLSGRNEFFNTRLAFKVTNQDEEVEDEYNSQAALLVTFQGQRMASRDKWAIYVLRCLKRNNKRFCGRIKFHIYRILQHQQHRRSGEENDLCIFWNLLTSEWSGMRTKS